MPLLVYKNSFYVQEVEVKMQIDKDKKSFRIYIREWRKLDLQKGK